MTPHDESDHDLLIRIDENLKNLIAIFKIHEKDDNDRFSKINDRLAMVEKACWGVGGALVFLEVVLKFVR